MRHESLSITSAITSDPLPSPLAMPAEFDLEIDEQRVAPAPRVREDLVRHAREFAHRAELLRRREPARDDLVGFDQRIVVGVVFEEELDHARHEQRAARDAGLALDERAGRDAAHDDFERNHLRAAHEHLVVVVVFAAAEVVRRQAAQVEQPEDARASSWPRSGPCLRSSSRRAPSPARDRVELRHDEHVGLTRLLVQHLGLAARDFVALCSRGGLQSLSRMRAARRRARGAASPTCARSGSSCARISAGST